MLPHEIIMLILISGLIALLGGGAVYILRQRKHAAHMPWRRLFPSYTVQPCDLGEGAIQRMQLPNTNVVESRGRNYGWHKRIEEVHLLPVRGMACEYVRSYREGP